MHGETDPVPALNIQLGNPSYQIKKVNIFTQQTIFRDDHRTRIAKVKRGVSR